MKIEKVKCDEKAMIRSYGGCLSLLVLLLAVGSLLCAPSFIMPLSAAERDPKSVSCAHEAGAAAGINTLSDIPQGQMRPLLAAYFSDAGGTLEREAMLAEDFRFDGCISSFPIESPHGVLWLRFEVANPYEDGKEWFITLRDSIVDEITLYERVSGGLVLVSHTGRTTPYVERPVQGAKLAVPFALQAGSTKSYYLRISGMFAPKATPTIMSASFLARYSSLANNMTLAMTSFMAMMAAVSLILYRHIAPKFSLLYAFYMVSQLALTLVYHDWLAQVPFMNLPVTFVARWTVFCGGAGALILVLFCRALLTTDGRSKWQELVFWVLLGAGGIVALLVIAEPWKFSGLLFVFKTLVPLTLIVLSVIKHRAGLVQAKWVAAGLASLVIGIGIGAYGFLSPAELETTSSVFDMAFLQPLKKAYFVAVFCEPAFMMIAISAMAGAMQKQRLAAVGEVEVLQQNLSAIKSEYSEVKRATAARVEALEAALADDPKKKEHLSAEQQFLERATECILDHVGEVGFDVGELASALGISQKTLGRRLKELHGLTSAAFIRSVRLNVARDLILLRRYNTVGEVAFAVGFSSVGYFAKLYRRQFEETPSESLRNISSS